MERRHFFRNVAIGGGLLITSPVLFNSCSDNSNDSNITDGITIDLTDSAYAALKTVGGFAYKDNIIVIRSSDNVYLALSKICTHSGCTISFNSNSNELPCPCHGSTFSKEGAVIVGPAERPLKKYDVKLEGNILTIS